MGMLFVFLTGSTLLASVFFGFLVYRPDLVERAFHPLPAIHEAFPLKDHVWTKSGKRISDNEAITPFKIDILQSDIDDLHARLRNTRFPKAVTKGVNFTYGFHPDYLKTVVNYWMDEFDWRKQEKMLNEYPHFKTEIEGLDIHFVHIKAKTTGKGVKTYPLMMLHGWPGSFFELYKMIPLLMKPREFNGVTYALDLIVPSLPSFGFSEAPETPGMDPSHMGRILDKLMRRLKYDKYFIFGTDWGSTIARFMAVMYPERILGIDITLYVIPSFPTMVKTAVASVFPSLVMTNISETYKLFSNLSGTFLPAITEMGFMHMQSTKPDTVAAGLSDSPAGLAAWIISLFPFFTHPQNLEKPDGGLPKYFSMDDLMTNVAIYWFTRTISTSMRIYKEDCGYWGCGIHKEQTRFPVQVPVVLSDFRYEVPGSTQPLDFVKPFFPKLISMSHHTEGGHFATLERPQDETNDIWILVHNVAHSLQ